MAREFQKGDIVQCAHGTYIVESVHDPDSTLVVMMINEPYTHIEAGSRTNVHLDKHFRIVGHCDA